MNACARPRRTLDRPGCSTVLVVFCDDGWRCPGNPHWKPWEPRRELQRNTCTAWPYPISFVRGGGIESIVVTSCEVSS